VFAVSAIYAIGDIHGCYDQLLVLLAKIKSHAGQQPYRGVFLGDYVDRGPKSREVVNQVRGLVTGRGGHGKWTALKGNHEEMMVAGVANTLRSFWQENGGAETLKSYEGHEAEMAEHAAWLNTLPTMLETENHVFVHAGLSPRYAIADQPDEVRLWIRSWERDDHDFGKHVVYGHTPRKTPSLRAHSSGLDTGAVFWGTLSAGVFDGEAGGGPIEILEAH
jgi:serine/threonine protein phosphatase 1